MNTNDIQLDIQNSESWELVWNQRILSQSAPGGRYYPIPNIPVPYLLDKYVIAVFASSFSAKSTWRYAGLLNQKVKSGLSVEGSTNIEVVEVRKIWLNRINLFILPNYNLDFAISFDVPYWFEDITFYVWKYLKPMSSTTEELLQALKTDVLRVEAKVDNIEQWR
jgi:hypothetical protein